MKRFINDPDKLNREFKFLFKKIIATKGELDLRLRNNYFNIYYRGNSLAKITPRNDYYEVSIHRKFLKYEKVDYIFGRDSFNLSSVSKNGNCSFSVPIDALRKFFKNHYLDAICRNIKEIGYSEELTYEQMVIADNLGREDLLIIDRQVTETPLAGKRIDLLALKQIKNRMYHFLIIEIKTGRNVELTDKVWGQIKGYEEHVRSELPDWCRSYGRNITQMQLFGFYQQLGDKPVEIDNKRVEYLLLVCGYSGHAEKQLISLKATHPEIKDHCRLITARL